MRSTVDRGAELADLERLQTDLPQLAVVRGRRRVGKSFLLSRGIHMDRIISYQATEGQRETQLELFAQEAARLVPGEPTLRFRTWDEAFAFVDAQASVGPLAVVIDEYQYVHVKDRSLASTIMKWWDTWERDGRPIFLVICGSALSVMRELVEGNKALFGRAAWRPQIEAFDYRTAAEFAPPTASAEDKIVRYGVLGGAAQYQVWGGGRPLKEVICETILSSAGPMYEEPLNLLRGERGIREPATYFSLLRLISEGKTQLVEMAGASEQPAPEVYQLLLRLESLGYVEHRRSVGKGTGQPYWRIIEPFHQFWFRYVYPNRSRLARGLIDPVYEEIAADLPNYTGEQVYEDCCRTWVGKYSPWASQVHELGSWWVADAEFDVVAKGKKDYALLGACEWSQRARSDTIKEVLEARDRLGRMAAKADLVVFARGFDSRLPAAAARHGVRLIGLDELFS
ncbi:MAG TPA: ATP-binding protein [Candidatus Dormibacteraeota bacterium]|nr:ATP-binding protein [Candidatus Dormibacteraeota bacterium]